MSLNPIVLPPVIGVSQQSAVSDQVSFIVLGFLFVVIVLASLALITSFIGLGFRQITPASPQSTPSPSPSQVEPLFDDPSSLFPDHEIPEHIPALIGAAAHAMLSGKPHRIVAIRRPSQNWAREGRREIFKSHKLR